MNVEVSNGEIVDKMTILELKLLFITDADKVRNVKTEWNALYPCLAYMGLSVNHPLYDALLKINKVIWDVEDKLREKENLGQFDDDFIKLARAVYTNNDERCRIKREINQMTNSNLIEEKGYAKYEVHG